MVHALLDYCKCKIKYKSISRVCFTVYLQWTREEAPQVRTTSAERQEPLTSVLKHFLSYADLITKGSFALRLVACGFTPPREGGSSYCSLSFRGDISKALSICSFVYTCWRLIKAFHTPSKCSKVMSNRCLP